MKVLTDYGNDFLENSGKKGAKWLTLLCLKIEQNGYNIDVNTNFT